nr:Gag-Pol polyprotein [Tanacetum cinerariifolium]
MIKLQMTSLSTYSLPRLKKALYGLKQAPRAWYDELSKFLLSKGFTKGHRFRTNCFLDLDHAGCLDSRKITSGGIQFLGGDKLVSWSSKKQDCTSMSSAEAELKKALYGLKQAPRAWYDELSKFLLSKGFTKGSVDPTLFITKHTGDILLKQIYVDDIIFGHRFRTNCFLDSDHAGCLDSRKITSGGIQFLGGDKLVSWSSKKQDCTSMSSVEAEYVSLFACCTQVLWMRTQLTDYGFHFDKIPMYCDSKAAIAISCNPVQHSRTKHIDVCYHFIKEKVKK